MKTPPMVLEAVLILVAAELVCATTNKVPERVFTADKAAATECAAVVEEFLNALKTSDYRRAYAQTCWSEPQHVEATFKTFVSFMQTDSSFSSFKEAKIVEARPHRGIGLVDVNITTTGRDVKSVHFELETVAKSGAAGKSRRWLIKYVSSDKAFP